MGGHGGLNILPQKRWNVYNYDNREKVRKDEEAAAKEEQLKREQSLKRDAEFRLEKLRQARGSSRPSTSKTTDEQRESDSRTTDEPRESDSRTTDEPRESDSRTTDEPRESDSRITDEPRESDSKHINLFEGIRIFDPVGEIRGDKKEKNNYNNKRQKKEEPVRVVTAEDEKYRLGYGVAGKGVKLPWYMAKPGNANDEKNNADEDDGYYSGELEFGKRKNLSSDGKKKKSLKEMREERLKRERKEKERERVLLGEKSRRDGGFSLRR